MFEAFCVAVALFVGYLLRYLLDRRPAPTPQRARRDVRRVQERVRRVDFTQNQPDDLPLVVRYPEGAVYVQLGRVDVGRDEVEQMPRYGEIDVD